MGDILQIEDLGQISKAEIEFGDLTVLVGPQATGKSIVLQLLKLVIDADSVRAELQRHGIDWAGQLPDFLDAYLGEGMRSLWMENATRIAWRGEPVDLQQIIRGELGTVTYYFLDAGCAGVVG